MRRAMAVEVRMPTILRKYTSGAKAVEGSGFTVREVIEDLDQRHPGMRRFTDLRAGSRERVQTMGGGARDPGYVPAPQAIRADFAAAPWRGSLIQES